MLKKYATNPKISDEEFVEAFLSPYVYAGKIKNKVGEEWHLNKTKVSTLLSGKIDVPNALRDAQSIVGIEDQTAENMFEFIEDYLRISAQDVQTFAAANLQTEVNDETMNLSKKGLSQLLTKLLFNAIREDNRISSTESYLWKHGVNSVSFISGDIFKYGFNNRRSKKNIIVIPVNTSFSTHVTRAQENEPFPLVSENTLHGKWLTRIIASGVSEKELTKRIQRSLEVAGIHQIHENQYPIGSIAVIETDSASYWLIAISVFDEENIARCSVEELRGSIENLLYIYNRRGQGNDIYIPLIGTGRSRTGLSSKESFNLIIDTMMQHKDLLQGTLRIIALPDAYMEVQNGV